VTEELFLSQTDSRPMYVQIIDQIKLRILSGDWASGQPLPSIRELAAASTVSVITVKRAYKELEGEGFIVTAAGRGSFVADVESTQSDLRSTELNKHIEALLDSAEKLGLESNVILEHVKAAIDAKANSKD
jgi:GntR family transcriptional regulator